jgi:hypothetical protein
MLDSISRFFASRDRYTGANCEEHFLSRCEFGEGFLALVNLLSIRRGLQNIAAKKSGTHGSQGFVQQAKKTLSRLCILEVLDQLKRSHGGYIDHHGSFRRLELDLERLRSECNFHCHVDVLQCLQLSVEL